MSLIVGVEYCKTDSNGRFKLPVDIKKQLELASDARFFIRKSIYSEGCLELFTFASFQSEVQDLQKKLNTYDPQAKRLYRRFIGGNIIELDTADRLLIPAEQRTDAKISRDIVVVGAGNYLEIWDAATYRKIDSDDFDYATAAARLLAKDNAENVAEQSK